MATAYKDLDIGAATLPDTNPAAISVARNTGPTPDAFFMQANFDASVQEYIFFSFILPGDYASAPVLRYVYKMASATSGNIIVEGRITAVSDGDAEDLDAAANMDTANTSSAVAVPGTAGYIDIQTLALTNADGMVAGDWVNIMFSRAAANGSDTATGDMELIGLAFEYTVA